MQAYRKDTNNNIFANNSSSGSGGGFYVDSSCTLTNNTFTGNMARSQGGGVCIGYNSTLTGNTFTGNTAETAGGGAYVGGGSTLIGNTFRENISAYGSGLHLAGDENILNRNTFTENEATSNGGGARVQCSGSYEQAISCIILTDNTFTGNTADRGGGISITCSYPIVTTTLTNNKFSRNTAQTFGGGVNLSNISNIILTGNTFTENKSKDGGGLNAGGIIVLTNNIFTDNAANNKGGGANLGGSSVTLTNNTLVGNTAGGEGGGAYLYLYNNSYTSYLYNNIVWGNTASTGMDLYIDNAGSDPFFEPVTVNLFNNDFDQSTSGTYIVKPFTIDPNNLNNADPLFVGSDDHHLTASSPCINAGDNDAPNLPTTDKDGNPRIMGGTVDIGAYEYQAVAYVNKDDVTCGGKPPCYISIQLAIDASSDGTLIKIVQRNLSTTFGHSLKKITEDYFCPPKYSPVG